MQLPNNLFYNTGISTYIWLLNNKKPANRQGKVQLIDASLLFRKLRKNLGDKNCEFAPEHIQAITQVYLACAPIERQLDANGDATGIASQVFDNQDLGYFKVTIERPDRRKAQFSAAAIAPLRFDKALRETMEHLYSEHGESVYEAGFLKSHSKDIVAWCEAQDISLNTKAKTKLLDTKTWAGQKLLLETAQTLMAELGEAETDDFNSFKASVDTVLKTHKIKLSAGGKKSILDAVSWYDESAQKVIKKTVKLKSQELTDLCERYACEPKDLPDFGFYPTDKTGGYLTYEPNSDLRDAETVPLKQSIYQYFLDEVQPHVPEAWINQESVKIGSEISFNKYFYQHKPLRALEDVASDILALEQKAEGLIAELLGVPVVRRAKA